MMADRGRKRLPKGMKVLSESGGRPDPKTRGTHERGSIPKAPSYLPGIAKRFWRDVAPILEEMGIGTEGDKWSLEGMAMLYYRARMADALILKDGSTFICAKTLNPKRRPEAVESLQCWKELRLMFNEVGLTPAARAKVMGDRKPPRENPFRKFA